MESILNLCNQISSSLLGCLHNKKAPFFKDAIVHPPPINWKISFQYILQHITTFVKSFAEKSSKISLYDYKIVQQSLSYLGENRLWMELHALYSINFLAIMVD